MARAYRHHKDRRPSKTSTRLAPVDQSAGPVARFLAMFKSEVPTGYEDETGFHFGVDNPGKHDRPSVR
jgi:hypothetical protein